MFCMRLVILIAVQYNYTLNGVELTLKYQMKFQSV